MKTLYQAANAVEAHMLVDVLKQEGVTAYVQGEHLQGAVGELPAGALIRLTVDEADYEAARAVIERWEAQNPAEPSAQAVRPQKPSRGLKGAVIGLLIGVAGTSLYYRAPISTKGIDYNGDGRLDDAWSFSPSGMILKSEVDRNLDGKLDYLIAYDKQGHLDSAEADDNFDGIFETHYTYYQGNADRAEVDTDGDGYRDLKTVFEHGVATRSELLDPRSGKPLRIEFYRLGLRTHAHVDTDKDGELDREERYAGSGELLSTEKLAK